MRKLYAAILSAAICLAVSGAPAWASEQQATLSAGYLHARTSAPGSDNLNGINVKYRYEFTDTRGDGDVIQLCRRQESPKNPLQRYPLA
ncbi:putative outer membrane protein [Escherichia coli TW11039]|nr:putative outer membrane protein [Escherichia coli TW11039]